MVVGIVSFIVLIVFAILFFVAIYDDGERDNDDFEQIEYLKNYYENNERKNKK